MSYHLLKHGYQYVKLSVLHIGLRPHWKTRGSRDSAISLNPYSSSASLLHGQSSIPTQHTTRQVRDDHSWWLRIGNLMKRHWRFAGHQKNRHQMWQSSWLSTTSLVAFIFIFTSLWAALLILRGISRQQNGLSLSLGNAPFLFKFGPTAILVIVISLWRQVDYNCKMLQPWHNLRNGPTSASRSILLDYVSTFQVVAFTNAFRHRNVAVIITVAVFVSLKVAIVFSTSLLTASPTAFMDVTGKLPLISSFRTLNNDIAIYDPLSLWFDERNGIDVKPGTDDYGAPSMIYRGVLESDLSMPLGVLGNFTTELFAMPQSTEARSSAMSVVKAFAPETRCEVGHPRNAGLRWVNNSRQYVPFSSSPGIRHVNAVTVDTLTCHLPFVWLGSTFHATESAIPTRGLFGFADYRNCTMQSPSDHFDVDNGDWRWIVVVADMSYEKDSVPIMFPQLPGYPNSPTYLMLPVFHDISVVLCDIDYTMVNATLLQTRDATGYQDMAVTTVDRSGDRQHLPGLSESMLNQAVARSLSSHFSARPDPLYAALCLPALFTLLALVSNGEKNHTEGLLTTTKLAWATETVLNNISQILVQNVLVEDSEGTINGSLTTFVTRLHVRELSFWVMFSSLIFSSCACLFLLWLRPSEAAPCNPNTIVASAAIMRTSKPSTRRIFSSIKVFGRHIPDRELEGYQFLTKSEHTFELCAEMIRAVRSPNDSKLRYAKHYWTPFAMRRRFIAFTMATSTLLIILLEVLRLQSDRRHGIANIASRLTDDYFLYTTSAVMLAVATLYNSVDFTVTALSPFNDLYVQSAVVGRNIGVSPIGRLPILALIEALRERRFGTVMSNTASMLGSFLTIVAAMLWTFDISALATFNVTLNRTDLWDTTAKISYQTAARAGRLSNLILRQNLSYPGWTYNDLAFPEMQLEQNAAHYSSIARGSVTYEASIPALRGHLTCDVAANATLIYTADLHHGRLLNAFFFPHVDTKLPTGCTMSTPLENFWWLSTRGGNESNYLAAITPFNLLPAKSNESVGSRGCPSFGVVYGLAEIDFFDEPLNLTLGRQSFHGQQIAVVGRLSPLSDVVFLLCYQGLEELMTNVSFSFKSGSATSQASNPSVVINKPPSPIESTARSLVNEKDGTTAFQWDIVSSMDTNLQKYTSEIDFKHQPRSNINIDRMFSSLLTLQGLDGEDYEALAGHRNTPRLIKALGDVWRVFAAQAIHEVMRVPLDTHDTHDTTEIASVNRTSRQQTVSAKALVPIQRVEVNRVANIILQCLLAMMTLCLLGCCLTSRLRDTLPHEPCSIASRMSLIAASDLVDRLPEGAERMSGKQADEFLKNAGWQIRLGWWNQNGDTKVFKVNNANNRDMISEIMKDDELNAGDVRREWRFGIDIHGTTDESNDGDL